MIVVLICISVLVLQVEGVIAEKNLSLAHLIGIFTEFFKKLGSSS